MISPSNLYTSTPHRRTTALYLHSRKSQDNILSNFGGGSPQTSSGAKPVQRQSPRKVSLGRVAQSDLLHQALGSALDKDILGPDGRFGKSGPRRICICVVCVT